MRRTRFPFVICLMAGIFAACDSTPARPSPATADVQGGLDAKGGPNKPPAEQPVTATFRCNDDSCAATDRIRGDGSSYAAWIDSGGNLRLALEDASRSITMDYTECLQPCPTGRRWFTTLTATGANGLRMHTSVLVPGTESETPRGMLDIPVGATWFSRIKIGLSLVEPSTAADLVWGMRFNPFFPGSTNLQVTRISENEWHVEATPSQIAWVVSIGASRRDGPEVFEGNYLMPFRIVVTR